MREDEIFGATAVVNYLGGIASFSPGEDPPDFWLDIGGRKVALEVTQLSPLSFGNHGLGHQGR